MFICIVFIAQFQNVLFQLSKGSFMTDKELQRLRRSYLIEILYYLRRENDELREENTALRTRLDTMIMAEQRAEKPQTAPHQPPHKSKKKR